MQRKFDERFGLHVLSYSAIVGIRDDGSTLRLPATTYATPDDLAAFDANLLPLEELEDRPHASDPNIFERSPKALLPGASADYRALGSYSILVACGSDTAPRTVSQAAHQIGGDVV